MGINPPYLCHHFVEQIVWRASTCAGEIQVLISYLSVPFPSPPPWPPPSCPLHLASTGSSYLAAHENCTRSQSIYGWSFVWMASQKASVRHSHKLTISQNSIACSNTHILRTTVSTIKIRRCLLQVQLSAMRTLCAQLSLIGRRHHPCVRGSVLSPNKLGAISDRWQDVLLHCMLSLLWFAQNLL